MEYTQVPKLYPCVLFKNEQKEAAQFYIEIFGEGQILLELHYAEFFRIKGMHFLGLNGGDLYQPNPCFSFMVYYKDPQELEKAWRKLSDGGIVLMPIKEYDWSPKYGWVQDKFGVSWQLILPQQSLTEQQISPCIMYSQFFQGKAEIAMNFYLQLFKNSKIDHLIKYESGELKGKIKYSQIELEGFRLVLMDSGIEQPFNFPDGVSIVVECDTQEEIDYYWNAFLFGGEEGKCGWIKDKFGVWWQIIPRELRDWMKREDWPKIMMEILSMIKIDLNHLRNFINR